MTVGLPVEVVWVFWVAIGLIIGSFLNVCIYRLPREQSLVWSRSRCPHCRALIVWYDNIPLLSYVCLGGQCRNCAHPISRRYPVIEALSAAATIGVFQWFGANAVGIVYLVFVWALIVVSVIDLDFQIIPDEISVGGLAVGLVVSVLVPQLHGTTQMLVALKRSVIGAVVGGGLLYGTGVLGGMVFRKEAMGGGDVKLLAMAGSLLGWKMITLTFFLAPVLAVIPGIVVLLTRRSHVIPYGPFLSLALVVSLFLGEQVLQVTGFEESVRLLWSFYGWGH